MSFLLLCWVYIGCYAIYSVFFSLLSRKYLFFPCNLGSLCVGIIIILLPTFNARCSYSLLLPFYSSFWLICFLSSLSCSYEFLKFFWLNIFFGLMYFLTWYISYLAFISIMCQQKHIFLLGRILKYQIIIKISWKSPFPFSSHCIYFCSSSTCSHLSYNCNSLLTSWSASSTPCSNQNTYHY